MVLDLDGVELADLAGVVFVELDWVVTVDDHLKVQFNDRKPILQEG